VEFQLVNVDQVTNNLDSKRIPLNASQRAEKSSKPLYPYIGANNILEYIDEYIFDEKILCVAEDGGSWGFNEKCAFIINEKCWVNNHAHVLTAKSNLHLEYLCYYLNFSDLSLSITGATRGKLNKSSLNKIRIPLPPLKTQKHIAGILDDAVALRDKTQNLLDEYDALAQSIFLEMFGDPVVNPKEWETKTIEELVSNKKGSIKRGPFGGALKKEIFLDSGYLVYEQYHALNNDFSFERYFINDYDFERLKSFEVKTGDIIISCSGVYLGKLAVIPKDCKKGVINQALLKLTLNEKKISKDFFVFHFRHENFRNKYFGANRGAGIPNFPPMKSFKKFKFISPPIHLQNQFAQKIELIEQQKALAKQELKEAEDLFNCFLQKAFKGELGFN